MKTAFTYWESRIAPVFDTARQIYIIETQSGQITGENYELLTGENAFQKSLRLIELGIDVLICGAISKQCHRIVTSNGIRVIPFVAGDLNEIIQVWITGNLNYERFAMPGCRWRGGRNFKIFYDSFQEINAMNPKKQDKGTGRGKQNTSGKCMGRMGGSKSAGPTGFCVCPKCGNKEQHQRGFPCTQRKCSQCGSMMTRD